MCEISTNIVELSLSSFIGAFIANYLWFFWLYPKWDRIVSNCKEIFKKWKTRAKIFKEDD